MTNRHKKIIFFEQSYILQKIRGSSTQEVFAKKLGIPLRTYARYEKGERKMPVGLVKFVLLFNENNEKVVLRDESLSLNEKGDSIKTYIDNFKMDLEVITRDEAERRKKAAAEPIYNIDQCDPSTPSASPAGSPAADPLREVIEKARQIMVEKSEYSASLIAHIESSYTVLKLDLRIKSLEEKFNKILDELGSIKKQLSTVGREKEDNTSAQIAGS